LKTPLLLEQRGSVRLASAFEAVPVHTKQLKKEGLQARSLTGLF